MNLDPFKSIEADQASLFVGQLFSKDRIYSYNELKWEETMQAETTPSAIEFDMYYSA